MKIRDLPRPVTASKADWLAGTSWLGFTPASGDASSRSQCQSTIQRQFAGGYVIEYITEQFSEPNPGFEKSPQYLKERERHQDLAGRFIAVHKLRPTSRSLDVIIGADGFKQLQDMWAQGGKRYRWSVAFPIVESYEIVGKPKAKMVLGEALYRQLYQRSSATLRVLNDDHRAAIADLEISPVKAINAWIAIEDEILMAEGSELDPRILSNISSDLSDTALEGLTEEQKTKIRKRAAWLARKFVLKRKEQGRLVCDDCAFDPTQLFTPKLVNPRSMLDVHHKNPLESGQRYTTLSDFALLCPTCHRAEHQRIKHRIPSAFNSYKDS